MKGLNKTGFQSCWTLESCREKIMHNCSLFIVPFSCRHLDLQRGTKASVFFRLPRWFYTAVRLRPTVISGLSQFGHDSCYFKSGSPSQRQFTTFSWIIQLWLSLAVNVCTDLQYKLLRKIVITCSRSYLYGPEPELEPKSDSCYILKDPTLKIS